MKLSKLSILVLVLIAYIGISCARGITVQQAANGKARCGMFIKN